MIYGTVVVSLIALLLAALIGIGAGMFVAEYLPSRVRFAAKITIELLAGVPSVVYGLLGILFLRNWIYQLLTPFDPLSGGTAIAGSFKNFIYVLIIISLVLILSGVHQGIPRLKYRYILWGDWHPHKRGGNPIAFHCAGAKRMGWNILTHAIFRVADLPPYGLWI